uniref:Putative secreted protein n=1 Tax=Anopheles darlingi TaxID=43151 RepID=A0A2M4DNQ5_ANODA
MEMGTQLVTIPLTMDILCTVCGVACARTQIDVNDIIGIAWRPTRMLSIPIPLSNKHTSSERRAHIACKVYM